MARREKKYHFIYKTTNNLTGKYYIGMHSTDDLNDGYLGSGKRLRYSIKKYGKKNHKREIVEFCLDRQELKEREREVVNLDEIAKQECMNIRLGGEGGLYSIEACRKGAEKTNKITKFLSETNPDWVKRRSENLSEGIKRSYRLGKGERKINYDWTGRKHSAETKKLISDKAKQKIGDKNSQYGTCWVTKDGVSKKIKKEELDNFIQQGWKKGRVIKIN